MVFHWSLNDSESHQVSRTLLSILAVLNNVVVWMVSTPLLISKSSGPFNNPLVTVSKAPIPNGIMTTFIIHSFFFNSLARSWYLSFFLFSFNFILRSAGTAKFCKFSFLCWLLYGLIFWPRLGDPFVYQNPIGVYVSHTPGQMLSCAYTICSYDQF